MRLARNVKIEAKLALYREQLKDYLRILPRQWRPGDIAIVGSFNTTNVGDLSIGMALQTALQKSDDLKVSLYGLHHRDFPGFKLILQGGGDTISDHFSTRNLHRFVSISQRPFILSGVGVPGVFSDEGKQLLHELLDKILYITVRDPESHSRLAEVLPASKLAKVEITADPAFLLQEMYPTDDIQVNKGAVGISAKPLLAPSKSQWIRDKKGWTQQDIETLANNYSQTIRAVVQYHTKNGMQFTFIPFAAEDLFFYNAYLSDLCSCAKLYCDPKKTLELVASMEYMVCTRYHSLIFAIISHTPMFLISYADKTDALARLIPNLSMTNRDSMYEFTTPLFSVKATDLKDLSQVLFKRSLKNLNCIYRFWDQIISEQGMK